jgi:hypothetical protein
VTFSNTTIVAAGSSGDLLVVYDFSGSAASGTYQSDLMTNTSVFGTGGNNQALQFTGAAVNSTIFTVVVPTPTSTSTPMPTATPTSTWTGTPTPILKTVVCPPQPNPSMGSGDIDVCVSVPGPSTVTLEVYTPAFRKICSKTVPVSSSSTLVWDQRDQWGAPAANGLYYLRVQVMGPAPLVKTLKVLILR